MDIYEHILICDSCNTKIYFPNSWDIDKPPNKGWVSIYTSNSIRKDFCPKFECLMAA